MTPKEEYYAELVIENQKKASDLADKLNRWLDAPTTGKPKEATLYANYEKATVAAEVLVHSLGIIGDQKEGLFFGALIEDKSGNLLEVDADRLKFKKK